MEYTRKEKLRLFFHKIKGTYLGSNVTELLASIKKNFTGYERIAINTSFGKIIEGTYINFDGSHLFSLDDVVMSECTSEITIGEAHSPIYNMQFNPDKDTYNSFSVDTRDIRDSVLLEKKIR